MLFTDLENNPEFKEIIFTVKNMNLAFFVTDINGDIIYINKSFELLSEYKEEDLLGLNPRIFKSDYHDEKFYKILWDTILSGNTWRGEILNKTKGNQFIWNSTIIIPIKNLEEDITYFATIRENINIQKETNFIQIKNDSFKTGPVILFNCNISNFKANYISPNIEEVLGYKPNEFISKPFGILSIVYKDDLKEVQEIIEHNKSLLGLNYFEIEFRIFTKNNKIKYLSGKINLIKNSINKVVNYHGYFIDITEKKNLEKKLCLSQNKFQIAINSVGYGVWDWNIETGAVFYSNNWKEMLGYEKSKDLNNISTWINSIHPLDKERVLKSTNKLLNRETDEYEQEYRLKTKNGNYKWILSKGKTLEWKDNKATRVIGTHVDLTERKQKEEYKYKTKNLESLGRLAGNIAHNFNNILMNIQGNIDLLSSDIPKNNEYLIDIEKSINRAKRLSKKMLIFSKGGDPVKTRVNNLDKIIIKRIKSLTLKSNHFNIINNIDKNLWVVDIDIDLFIEAMDNIITNSIEAMPDAGTFELNIKNISRSEDKSNINKNYILISLKDTGRGIPNSIINKIFEPFFTTMPHEKEGVGLTTVNAIISKHNGHIYISSEENKGTEVKIYIPSHSNSKVEVINNNNKKKQLKILVMDDEELILKVTNKFLEKSGYIVELATNGEEAIEKYKNALKNTPFDIIIMDLIIVNGMNGEETIKELLKIDKSVKVIASSGYSNGKIMSNYQDYGFKAVLAKPYKLSALKDLIKSI